MQRELEEVQDKFREDEMDLCRELQRELEATTKMCRVLQFKLRKSEQKLKACYCCCYYSCAVLFTDVELH